jgi:hypothetical protein
MRSGDVACSRKLPEDTPWQIRRNAYDAEPKDAPLLALGGHPGRARSPLPLSPCLWGKCKDAGGGVNASILLHLWIGSGVANHIIHAGLQSGLRLVLRALQASRNLLGAACRRDLLCLRAADGEWSDIRSQRVYGRASHAAFRIAGSGDGPSEREVCHCGD